MHLGRDEKMPHFIQYPASPREKEGMQMVQETVPFKSEKPQIKAYFLLVIPCIKKYACNHESETFK